MSSKREKQEEGKEIETKTLQPAQNPCSELQNHHHSIINGSGSISEKYSATSLNPTPKPAPLSLQRSWVSRKYNSWA